MASAVRAVVESVDLVESEARRAAAVDSEFDYVSYEAMDSVDYVDSESPRLPGEASGQVESVELVDSVDLVS